MSDAGSRRAREPWRTRSSRARGPSSGEAELPITSERLFRLLGPELLGYKARMLGVMTKELRRSQADPGHSPAECGPA